MSRSLGYNPWEKSPSLPGFKTCMFTNTQPKAPRCSVLTCFILCIWPHFHDVHPLAEHVKSSRCCLHLLAGLWPVRLCPRLLHLAWSVGRFAPGGFLLGVVVVLGGHVIHRFLVRGAVGWDADYRGLAVVSWWRPLLAEVRDKTSQGWVFESGCMLHATHVILGHYWKTTFSSCNSQVVRLHFISCNSHTVKLDLTLNKNH